MKQGSIATALAAALLVAASAPAPARDLYRWVDEDGNVQYSDRPPAEMPPGGYDGPQQPRMADVMRAQREEQRRLEREEAARRRREAEAQAYLESTAPPPKIESRYTCEEAKRFAAYYAQPGQPFYTQEPDGGYRRSTPEEIRESMESWQEAARLLCAE